MATRNEHLVVIMLEPVSLGEEFEVWPPHVTIVPWFPCDNEGRLDEILNKVAGRHKPLTVKADEVQEWGRKQKFEVQLVKDESGLLHKLHQDVFENLENNGFPIHQKDFMGEKYTPHIALRNRLQAGTAMGHGREININDFTLIKQLRLKGSGRMIKTPVKDYHLG
jgi:2'-5' RNA ligase